MGARNISSKYDKNQKNPFQSINVLPSITSMNNMSPNVMQVTNGSNGGAHFGSGKVGSNNGSSSGGSVFSGVAK